MTFVFLQGMVEVVAENYHNIWAKKKKSELVSKGVLMCSLGEEKTLILAAVFLKTFLIGLTRRRDPPAAGAL